MQLSKTTVLVISAITATGFFAAVTAPRALPAVIYLGGITALFVIVSVGGLRRTGILRTPVVAALFMLIGYLFINSFWALDPAAALRKTGQVAGLSVAAVALAMLASRTAWSDTRRILLWGLAALVAGLAVLLLEISFDQPVMKFVLNKFPRIGDLSSKHFTEVNGKVVSIEAYLTNRNVTVATIFFWPALLMTTAAPALSWRRGLQGALVALTLGCAALSDSGTALVALVVGMVAFGLGHLSLPALRTTVLVGWTAGMLLAIPLGSIPQKLGWTEWKWLPEQSVAARFHIWAYTAEKARENLVTGIGVRSTRELQKTDGPRVWGEDRFRPRPGRHAHNAFLQIWLELGAIGALIVTALGIASLHRIGRLERHASIVGHALFVTVCGVAAFGFGIWQTWLLSAMVLTLFAFLLGLRGKAPAPGAGEPYS